MIYEAQVEFRYFSRKNLRLHLRQSNFLQKYGKKIDICRLEQNCFSFLKQLPDAVEH